MICLTFQKVSNCDQWNVEIENPPTYKRRDDISCGNFGMTDNPNVFYAFSNYK